MSIESVDDLILTQMTGTQPPKADDVPHETPKAEQLSDNSAPKVEAESSPNEYGDQAKEPSITNGSSEAQVEPEDEYGLAAEQQEEEVDRKYTKAEMKDFANRAVRERLERMERNGGQQATQQQVQQQVQAAQENFQYDENPNLDWQQQLKQFIRQTSAEQEAERVQQMQMREQQERMSEFEARFQSGVKKFRDYTDVVNPKNITDEMVYAAEDIKDPAAFFYAAAKRAPDELAKIAAMKSPYAQASAIGRLDEKLRKQAVTTSKAPRPIAKTQGDMTIAHKEESKTESLDDLLVADARKRQALLAQRRR